MVNTSKNKGNRFEISVLKKLRDLGFTKVYSPRGSGNGEEKGDIILGEWVIECKHHKRITKTQIMNYLFKLMKECPDHNTALIYKEDRGQIMFATYFNELLYIHYLDDVIHKYKNS